MIEKPNAQLFYKGVNIWNDIVNEVVSLTVVDNLDDEADELQLTVKNDHGRWFNAWFPTLNDEMRVSLGYTDGRFIYLGTFYLDEPTATGDSGGDLFSLRGQSKPVDKAMKTPKTKDHEGKALRQIAKETLSAHGLEMVGTPPAITFERITQRREFDLAFLARLANDYGSFFSVKGGKGVFVDRDELFKRAPARIVTRGGPSLVDYNLTHKSDGTHSRARVTYFDGQKRKMINVEVEDRDILTGDTLRIDERVESEDQAKKLAKSRLQKSNMQAFSGSVTFVGDPLLQAGQTLQLADFGVFDRKYAIVRARHQIDASGYTTNIEIEDARSQAA